MTTPSYKRIRIRGCSYIVYSSGLIWSCAWNKYLSAHQDKDGYSIVWMGGKKRKVHRVVCRAFHGTPPEGYVARHKNGDTSNNRASNLQWGTTSDNERDKWRHGTHNKGSRHGRSHLTEDIVLRLRALVKKQPPGTKTAFLKRQSQKYGASWQAIGHACAGRTWTHI